MNKQKKSILIYYSVVIAILFFLNLIIIPYITAREIKEVDYSAFLDMIEKNKVTEVEKQENQILFIAKEDGKEQIYKTGLWDNPDLTQLMLDKDIKFGSQIQEPPGFLASAMGWIIPLLIFLLAGRLMSRFITKQMGSSGAFGLGKSNAKIYVKASTGKTFNDVAGQEEAKDALKEIVSFLHNPQRYARIGAKLPKGALLVGPPGTGKTLLAQAVAGEANVPFFSISGSEFIEMFVGMGAAKVRDLFKQANEKAPCIVFIDEIDTVGKKREGYIGGGNDEREQTLNQLLSEMDGFDGKKGIVILAATNRPDSLDPALLRPGRFDRRIPVELPDLNGRIEILKVHARNVKTDGDIDYKAIGLMTAGASGADLANMINEAALRAVRENRDYVIQKDIEESVEVVIAGYERKSMVISSEEKKIISYHEVGHALVAACQTNSAPVAKITIIPRTSGALGYTLQIDTEEKFLMSEKDLFNEMVTLAGGRAAEELVFNSKTTGASNDIERMTKIARGMVSQFGMNEDFDMIQLAHQTNRYLGGDTSFNASEGTLRDVDQAVIDLIKKAHNKAIEILKENIDKLHYISDYLLKKETITGEEFMEIFNGKKILEENNDNFTDNSLLTVEE